MWVKGSTTTEGVLYTEGWSGSAFRAQFRVNANGAGKLEIEYRTYDGTYLIANNSFSTTTVFDGSWHHIAIVGTTTAGMTTTVLYVDGVADATDFGSYLRPTAWDNTDGGSLNHSVIGQIARAGDRTLDKPEYSWYNGEVDEFRAWKRALDVTEIQNNMCTPLNTTDLYRHVKFNEGTGTVFSDEIGGNAGNLLGATSSETYTTNSGCVSTAIDNDKLIDEQLVFPNPALNFINLVSDVREVQIFNVGGNLVKKEQPNNNTVDISDLSAGIYLIKLSLDNNRIVTTKLIKR